MQEKDSSVSAADRRANLWFGFAESLAQSIKPQDIASIQVSSLQRITEYFVPTGGAALLWLVDEGRLKESEELRLAYCWSATAVDPADIKALKGVRLDLEFSRRDSDAQGTITAAMKKALARDSSSTSSRSRINYWLREQGKPSACEVSIPVFSPSLNPKNGKSGDETGSIIAVIQIFTDKDLRKTENTQDFGDIAVIVEKIITRCRDEKIKSAISELNDKTASITRLDDFLKVISDILLKYIGASACLIHKPSGAGSTWKLAAVAGSFAKQTSELELHDLSPTEVSLTYHVFKQSKRLRLSEIGNSEERSAKCDGKTPEEHLLQALSKRMGKSVRAWMACPVRVKVASSDETPANGDSWISDLVITVVNKERESYLGQSFSRTDQELIKRCCEYVASHILYFERMPVLDENIMTWAQSAIRDDAMSSARAESRPIGTGTYGGAAISDPFIKRITSHIHGVVGIKFSINADSYHDTIISYEHEDVSSAVASPSGRTPIMERTAGIFTISAYVQNKKKYIAVLNNQPGENAAQQSQMIFEVVVQREALAEHELAMLRQIYAEMIHVYFEPIRYRIGVQRMLGIRHALKSSLQGIIGHVSQIRAEFDGFIEDIDSGIKTSMPISADEYLQFIKKASLRKSIAVIELAATEARQFLDEFRFLWKKLKFAELVFNKVDLAEMLKDIARLLRPEAELRGITLTVDNKGRERGVYANVDKKLLQIAFYNIIDNAIKYSYLNKSIKIVIDERMNQWFCEVSNTGVYIDPADYELIFKPFVRSARHDPHASNLLSRRPGTGLGLAIVRAIIKAHSPKAEIRVKSTKIAEENSAITALTCFTLAMPKEP